MIVRTVLEIYVCFNIVTCLALVSCWVSDDSEERPGSFTMALMCLLLLLAAPIVWSWALARKPLT
jgi:hypothetical protein